MKGVKVIRNNAESSLLFHIEELSQDLKDEIRTRLSSICYGESSANSSWQIYSYKETLAEFLTRYESKSDPQIIGMIGELLSHLLIMNEYPNFQAVSPFFNLEERSIKKGFDLVIYDTSSHDLWISEVKSGECGSKTSNTKNISLLNNAKNDLKIRLNEQNKTIWLNAIHGAQIALISGKVKDKINDILESITDDVIEHNIGSEDKDVILISVLFNSLSDKISIDEIVGKRRKIIKENLFKSIIVCSIQKETYQKIEDYLRAEARK